MSNTIFSVALAATLLAIAPPAHAAPAVEEVSVEVHYDDLDLTTPSGLSTLSRRLRAAAYEVCGSADIRDIQAHGEVTRCRAAAKVELALADARIRRHFAVRTASLQ